MHPKKLILLFAFSFILGAVEVFSQTPAAASAVDAKPKTELEAFQAKYGSVIVKGYSELSPATTGSGGSLQLRVMEFRNPSNNTKVKCLVAEIDPSERYASTARSFIEYGELDSLIKGVLYISKIDKSVTTLQSFEAQYTTKDDFEVTVFNRSSGEIGVAVSVGRFGSKSLFLSAEQLASFVTQLQQAKTMLDAL
jgi:hypothetical protein